MKDNINSSPRETVKQGELITNTNGEQFRVLTVQKYHVTGLQYCKDDSILSPAIKVIKVINLKN
jgi:hypothetical protein